MNAHPLPRDHQSHPENLYGQATPPADNSNKDSEIITPPISHKKSKFTKAGIITTLALVIGMAATVHLTQQPQDIRQQAKLSEKDQESTQDGIYLDYLDYEDYYAGEANNLAKPIRQQTGNYPVIFENATPSAGNGYISGDYIGFYDQNSNSTYIAARGGIRDGLSEVSPYVTKYNHTTQSWHPPVKVFTNPVRVDTHHYPSIFIDDEGYIHLLYSFHGVRHPLQHKVIHAVSSNPYDISQWQHQPIPDTDTNTYGTLQQANNGDIYYVYRDTVNMPHEAYPYWHEPLKVIISRSESRNGTFFNNWEHQVLVDPGMSSDHWNTVYLKSINYVESPHEGIQLLYGVHYNHNDNWNKHYYVFYRFDNRRLYSASGQDLGTTVSRSQYESCCTVIDYGRPLNESQHSNIRAVMRMDSSGTPSIFYVHINPDENPGPRGALRRLKWEINQWQPHDFDLLGDVLSVDHIEESNNNDPIFIIRDWISETEWLRKKYSYDGNNLHFLEDMFSVGRYLPIINKHASLPGIVMFPNTTNWNWAYPDPVGIYYAHMIPTPTPTPVPLPAPNNFTVTFNPDTNVSTLSWANQSGAINYRVERCSGVNCTNFTQIASPTSSPHTVSVTSGQTHRYRIRSFNGSFSPYTNIMDSSISWNITAQPICSNGATPTQQTRLYHAPWPPDPLNWTTTPWRVGSHTLNLTSNHSWNNYYIFMQGTGGVGALQPHGNPPHSGITYGTYFNPQTWMAKLNRNSSHPPVLPSGSYTINYQAPDSWCQLPEYKVFVTSTTHNGNLGGLTGADNICQQRANAAGLSGTYRAWLSTNTVHARDRIPQAKYSMVNGQLIANDRNQLLSGNLTHRINRDEFGATRAFARVYTGTNSNGIGGSRTCSNWITNTSSVWGSTGNTQYNSTPWTYNNAGDLRCNSTARIYCFQVGE